MKNANLFGFLNIYKPKGITSFDVVYKLRKILNIKKIGHAGTLDPLAEGVLPVAVGNASRLLEYLKGDKEYIAEIKFGEISTTGDCEGEKEFIAEPKFSKSELEEVLKSFIGVQKQIPPKYSAIKINGKKLYELARSGVGINDIPEREIEIYSIKLLDFNLPYAKIQVECSSGTYIRSLVSDIGHKLETGAYMSDLTRVKSNGFEIENSLEIEKTTAENIINPIRVLNFEKYELNENELKRVLNGNFIDLKKEIKSNFILLIKNGKLIAIGKNKIDKITIDKVLNIC